MSLESRPEVAGHPAQLLAALRFAVTAGLPGHSPVAVLYSGGVDSSIIARLAAESARVHLAAVGIAESHDLRAAATGARQLGLPLTLRCVSTEEISAGLRRWAPFLDGLDPVGRAVALSLGLALEATDEPTVLVGQGADELFYGYAHFRGLSPVAARARSAVDLGRLQATDWPVAAAIAASMGRRLVAPFLDPTFIERAVRRMQDEGGGEVPSKPVLRDLARSAGLPEPLVRRPKKALQYGSGIQRELRRLSLRP